MTFVDAPGLSFDLIGIGPGLQGTDCLTIGVGQACSIQLGPNPEMYLRSFCLGYLDNDANLAARFWHRLGLDGYIHLERRV
jgi:hypothetical protein